MCIRDSTHTHTHTTRKLKNTFSMRPLIIDYISYIKFVLFVCKHVYTQVHRSRVKCRPVAIKAKTTDTMKLPFGDKALLYPYENNKTVFSAVRLLLIQTACASLFVCVKFRKIIISGTVIFDKKSIKRGCYIVTKLRKALERSSGAVTSVSYTHLDVYKRQAFKRTNSRYCLRFFWCVT